MSAEGHHLRQSHARGVCRSIQSTLLRDASEDGGIPNFGWLFHSQNSEDWGHEDWGLVLRYDQNVLFDTIFIPLLNGLSYYHQPFLCPISVECLALNCMVEYTDENQGIILEIYNVRVQ
jgi:hypothetical protein